jgi:cyclophilin family peptidyl-prolyl cis-trans isomerase
VSPAGDRKAAREAAKREAARRRRNRMLAVGGVVLVALLAVVLLAGRGGDDTTDVASRFGEDGDDGGAEEPADAGDRPAGGDGRAFAYGTGACPPEERPAQRPTGFPDAPQRCLGDGVDYSAEIVTSEGTFVIDLFEEGAPGTVNNFVVLARSGWFDGDDFHRIVPGFVIQAGDPVGDPPGTGGPGYTIPDELDVTDGYPEGAVAMAKTAAPDSAGSQWFVCIDCSSLPPEYSLFGQVVEGIEIVRRINELGQADQTPSRPVAITRVEIVEA